MSKDIYQTVTDRLLAALEQAKTDQEAGRSWEMPWVRVRAGGSPVSIHGSHYRGINFVILFMLGGVYPSQLFGTYRGWQQKGAQVRKGERGIPVIFWKFIKVRDPSSGEEKTMPFARGYTVFAAEQVEGYDLAKHQKTELAKLPSVAVRIGAAELAVKSYLEAQGIKLAHGGNRAFYAPSADQVQMPMLEAFRSTEGYYATLFHELGHSTGHEKRLNRQFGKRFGDHAYAVEELVAEFSAAMMCARMGINTMQRDDHAHYLASWLKALKDNPKAAVSAAAAAQHASDLVLGVAPAVEETEELAEAA
jgi:antirestriction protein ArdC